MNAWPPVAWVHVALQFVHCAKSSDSTSNIRLSPRSDTQPHRNLLASSRCLLVTPRPEFKE